jgi:hypothetical protein
MHLTRWPILAAIGVAFVAITLRVMSPGAANAADRLILRNLDILSDRTVVSFDEDGLVLDGSPPGGESRVTWDEVERGRVALDQPRFDRLLAELGEPLFRLRQRLKIGDYESLAEPAEATYPRFAQRKSQTAYLVCQATMWSRLAAGQREAAVEPYVRCFELLRSRAAASSKLPGARRLQADPVTGMSPELVPVWFDGEAAKAALPGVQVAVRSMAAPRPEGMYVYYASLAIAAGEASEAERVLRSLTSRDGELLAWRGLLAAQQELAASSPGPALEQLRSASGSLPASCRPAALYWLGLADSQSSDPGTCKDGILRLLALPAEYGEAQPELAAAGLYHAAAALAKLKDDRGAEAVRGELAGRYGGTWHAQKLQAAER